MRPSFLTGGVSPPSEAHRVAAEEHQAQLTKPAGSLGEVEAVAIRLCAMQRTSLPTLERVAVRIYAGDHGVVEEGVSAFPQAVTLEMMKNFSNGGAAISVLAKAQAMDFAVVNVGAASDVSVHPSIVDASQGLGTRNFCQTEAMTIDQLDGALNAGASIAEALHNEACQLFVGGEMGIGNTTSAAAIACALLDKAPSEMVGRGTGVDDEGLARKVEAVTKALALHRLKDKDPLTVLQCVGGFEIAALTATYLRCAQLGIPSLVDGFICTAAALLAVSIQPSCRDWLFFSHQGSEAGHEVLLASLKARALLSLGLRLGEGSGAALAVPLLRLACEIHTKMATFAQASVSGAH